MLYNPISLLQSLIPSVFERLSCFSQWDVSEWDVCHYQAGVLEALQVSTCSFVPVPFAKGIIFPRNTLG